MRPRPAAVTGSTGAQQRLRHGLGEHKPYRWHGKPGWNPARALGKYRSKDRLRCPCGTCGAQPGEQCRAKDGTHMTRNSHDGR